LVPYPPDARWQLQACRLLSAQFQRKALGASCKVIEELKKSDSMHVMFNSLKQTDRAATYRFISVVREFICDIVTR